MRRDTEKTEGRHGEEVYEMIIQALEKIKQQTIISSLLLMIVGLLMLIIPVQHDEVLVEVIVAVEYITLCLKRRIAPRAPGLLNIVL
jgi:hypothetical protein